MYKIWATHKTLEPFIKVPLNGFTNKNKILFNNKDKLSVFIFEACLCGGFNEEKDCIAWDVVKYEKGGVVASFGFIPISYGYIGNENILLGLNSYMDLSLFNAYTSGVTRVGNLMQTTLTDFLHYHINMDSTDFHNLEG